MDFPQRPQSARQAFRPGLNLGGVQHKRTVSDNIPRRELEEIPAGPSSNSPVYAADDVTTTPEVELQWHHHQPSRQGVSAETRARWELLRALVGTDHQRSTNHGNSAPSPKPSQPLRPQPSLKRNRSYRKAQVMNSRSSSGGIRPLMLPQIVQGNRQSPHAVAEVVDLGQGGNVGGCHPQGIRHGAFVDYPQLSMQEETVSRPTQPGKEEERTSLAKSPYTAPDIRPLNSLASALFQGIPDFRTSMLQDPSVARPVEHNAANTVDNLVVPRLDGTKPLLANASNTPVPALLYSPRPVVAESRSPVPSSIASPVSDISSATPRWANSNFVTPQPSQYSPHDHRIEPISPLELAKPGGVPTVPSAVESSVFADEPLTNTLDGVQSDLGAPPFEYADLLSKPPEEVFLLLAQGKVSQDFLRSPEGQNWLVEGESYLDTICLIQLTQYVQFSCTAW
jgi:hypothetical protein